MNDLGLAFAIICLVLLFSSCLVMFQISPTCYLPVVLGRVRLGRQSGRLVRVARGSFNPLGVFSYSCIFVFIFVATGISSVSLGVICFRV